MVPSKHTFCLYFIFHMFQENICKFFISNLYLVIANYSFRKKLLYRKASKTWEETEDEFLLSLNDVAGKLDVSIGLSYLLLHPDTWAIYA